MKKSLGMSSRGHEAEQEMLIADLLHTEQHLAESIQKNPSLAEELGVELDKARLTRQKAVSLWSNNNGNSDVWCATKHSIEANRRSQELLENTARLNPEQLSEMAEIANEVNEIKENVSKTFLTTGKKSSGGCKRCAGDLSYSENISDVENFEATTSEDNTVFFFLLLVGIGVSIYAFSKLQK